MKHISLLLTCALLLPACDAADPDAAGHEPGVSNSDDSHASTLTHLELDPRVVLVGLGDVHDAIAVTHLSFEADLFVLPADASDDSFDGDAVPIRFSFDDGQASTELPDGALRLGEAGVYRVLVRVRPADDAAAVTVGGTYARPEGDDLELRKADDEPAPSPARGPAGEADEPAPSPADEAGEPAPSPADEPAPSPADEPAPSPADEPAPSPAEPAPSPADESEDYEPAPSPARHKGEEAAGFDPGETRTEGDALFVRSNLAYEFYAGEVEVTRGDRELVVTWDVRAWLRGLLAEPLGIQAPAASELRPAPTPGFQGAPGDFSVESR